MRKTFCARLQKKRTADVLLNHLLKLLALVPEELRGNPKALLADVTAEDLSDLRGTVVGELEGATHAPAASQQRGMPCIHAGVYSSMIETMNNSMQALVADAVE